MMRLKLLLFFVFIVGISISGDAQIRRKKSILDFGIGYSGMGYTMNQGPLRDSSVSNSGIAYPSFNVAVTFSLTKKRKKWKHNMSIFYSQQSAHVRSSNYRWHDATGVEVVEPSLAWDVVKRTAGIRYLFQWKIPVGKKGDLGATILKAFGINKTNGIVYSGISVGYNLYESYNTTLNPNFNLNKYKLSPVTPQIILLGISGFPPRKGVGFNLELAVGGPYFVKAGIAFAL